MKSLEHLGEPVAGDAMAENVSGTPTIDMARAELAAADFAQALGIDLRSEHLIATPGRMAKAWAEMLTSRPFELTTFPNEEKYAQLIVVGDIAFQSLCEHHLLPFTGRASIGYLPGERIVGLSKLARIVEHFARRPQTQEGLTQMTANWVQEHLAPRAVAVVLNAEHSCMTLRGVKTPGSRTITSAFFGKLRDDPVARQEFFSLCQFAS